MGTCQRIHVLVAFNGDLQAVGPIDRASQNR